MSTTYTISSAHWNIIPKAPPIAALIEFPIIKSTAYKLNTPNKSLKALCCMFLPSLNLTNLLSITQLTKKPIFQPTHTNVSLAILAPSTNTLPVAS